MAKDRLVFDSAYMESSCGDITILLIADERTETTYTDKMVAETARTNSWKLLKFDSSLVSKDDKKKKAEPSTDDYDCVFKNRFTGNPMTDYKAEVGDFVVLDARANAYGTARTVRGLESLVGKMDKAKQKNEAEQQRFLDRANDSMEKHNVALAVSSLERVAKEGFRGAAWDEAAALYGDLMNQGVEALETAAENKDREAIENVGKTYGTAFRRRVSEERVKLNKAS